MDLNNNSITSSPGRVERGRLLIARTYISYRDDHNENCKTEPSGVRNWSCAVNTFSCLDAHGVKNILSSAKRAQIPSTHWYTVSTLTFLTIKLLDTNHNFSTEILLMQPRDALLQTPLFSVTVVTDTFIPKPSTVTQTCISNTSKKTRKCQMNKLVQRMSNPS